MTICDFNRRLGWDASSADRVHRAGVTILPAVLRSPRAVAVSVEIVRAFIRLRHKPRQQGDLVRRLDDLEAKYDASFKDVFDAIRG